MHYNRLGRSGLEVSALSFGSWLTFGSDLDRAGATALLRRAFDRGVNFFDNAEGYRAGEAERLMGAALRDLPRSDYVVSTKIFWGGEGPNKVGLSRKRIHEGVAASLARLGCDHVDLLFCHRPDPATPIEETVRAMDLVIRRGQALYWGTSEWSADQITEAHRIARELGAFPPTMEQPQYHLFHRLRVEVEYAPLYERFGLGTTTWSPLASGVLTGKYQSGIPAGSRLEKTPWLAPRFTPEIRGRVAEFLRLAGELGVAPAPLAIAFCLAHPRVSTVILGATSAAQLDENLEALSVLPLLTPEVRARLAAISGPVSPAPVG